MNIREQLIAELRQVNPQLKKDMLYERCVNKYVDGMLLMIQESWALDYKSTYLQAGEFLFNATKAQKVCGQIGKNPQQHIYNLMQQHSQTSFVIQVQKGFNVGTASTLSRVVLNPRYRKFIFEELTILPLHTSKKRLDEIEHQANYYVEVDKLSLASYISKTSDTLKESFGKSTAYTDKLRSNLAAASNLLSMVHEPDSEHQKHYINEQWKQADCGRLYGQGFSLQRMTKEVRHAALGACHKYDIKACAFALMAGLAHAIDSTLKIASVLEYVKDRASIRSAIAQEVNIPVELVKTIFTSLGFGAELVNNQFHAIRGEIAKHARQSHDKNVWLDKAQYNKLGNDEYERLISNETFKFIYEELELINTTILDYFSKESLAIGDFTYSDVDPKTSKKRTDKQKLAWIYQALEAQAMLQFCEIVQSYGQSELLTTHDCVYLKKRLTNEQIIDIQLALRERFSYLRFEHEAIFPISTDDHFATYFADAKQDEEEHKQRMRQLEADSVGYVSVHSHSNAARHFAQVPLTDEQYELQRRNQFLKDTGQLSDNCFE
jgi:hypothetical protein